MNSQWCNHMWHGHNGVMAHGSWQYDLPTSGSIVWPLAIPPELNKSAWFHALTDRTKEAGVPLRFVKPCGAFCVCFCQGGSVEFCEALCFFFPCLFLSRWWPLPTMTGRGVADPSTLQMSTIRPTGTVLARPLCQLSCPEAKCGASPKVEWFSEERPLQFRAIQ